MRQARLRSNIASCSTFELSGKPSRSRISFKTASGVASATNGDSAASRSGRKSESSCPVKSVQVRKFERSKVENALIYPQGHFPTDIAGNDLDSFLLSLWESSVLSSDPYRRFLYSYQIVEYAAFYYLKDEIFRAIKRILVSPELPSTIDNASKQIPDIMVEEKANDEAKFNSVVQQCVNPSMIWKEIEPKLEFFSGSTDFDGGFSISPFVKKDWKFEDFKTAWTPKLPDTLRKIRNALVHAREQRQSKSLSPTSRNQHLLRSWVSLMSAVQHR